MRVLQNFVVYNIRLYSEIDALSLRRVSH